MKNCATYFTVPSGVGANILDTGRELLAKYGPKAQKLLAKVVPQQEEPASSVAEPVAEPPGYVGEPAGAAEMPGWAKVGLALGALFVVSSALRR